MTVQVNTLPTIRLVVGSTHYQIMVVMEDDGQYNGMSVDLTTGEVQVTNVPSMRISDAMRGIIYRQLFLSGATKAAGEDVKESRAFAKANKVDNTL